MKIYSINNNFNKNCFKGNVVKKSLPIKKAVQNSTNIKKSDVIKFLKAKISTLKLKKEKYEALFAVLNKNTQDNKNNLSVMRDSDFSKDAFPLFEHIFYKEREEFSAIKDEIPIIEKTITKFENLLENLEK